MNLPNHGRGQVVINGRPLTCEQSNALTDALAASVLQHTGPRVDWYACARHLAGCLTDDVDLHLVPLRVRFALAPSPTFAAHAQHVQEIFAMFTEPPPNLDRMLVSLDFAREQIRRSLAVLTGVDP